MTIKLYAFGVLLVGTAVVIGCFVLWPDRYVTVHGDNFRVTGYSISGPGAVHTVYKGNQAMGRVKAMLRHRLGLKFVRPTPSAHHHMTEKSLGVLLHYRGDFRVEELEGLAAVLTDGKDVCVHKTGAVHWQDQVAKSFTKQYFFSHVATSDSSFRIDFYLASEYEEPIASLRIGEMYNKN